MLTLAHCSEVRFDFDSGVAVNIDREFWSRLFGAYPQLVAARICCESKSIDVDMTIRILLGLSRRPSASDHPWLELIWGSHIKAKELVTAVRRLPWGTKTVSFLFLVRDAGDSKEYEQNSGKVFAVGQGHVCAYQRPYGFGGTTTLFGFPKPNWELALRPRLATDVVERG